MYFKIYLSIIYFIDNIFLLSKTLIVPFIIVLSLTTFLCLPELNSPNKYATFLYLLSFLLILANIFNPISNASIPWFLFATWLDLPFISGLIEVPFLIIDWRWFQHFGKHYVKLNFLSQEGSTGLSWCCLRSCREERCCEMKLLHLHDLPPHPRLSNHRFQCLLSFHAFYLEPSPWPCSKPTDIPFFMN